MQLPTFLGNHDMGRIGGFILKAKPDISDGELRGAHDPGPCPDDVQAGRAGDLLRRRAGLRRRRRRTAPLAPGHVRDARSPPMRDDRRSSARLQPAVVRHDAPHVSRDRRNGPARASATSRLRRGLQPCASRPTSAGSARRFAPVPNDDGETLIVFNTSTEPITANVEVGRELARAGAPCTGDCPAARQPRPAASRVTVPAARLYDLCFRRSRVTAQTLEPICTSAARPTRAPNGGAAR